MPGKAAGTEEEFATPSRFDSQGLLQRDMPEAGAGSAGTDGITARQAEIPPKVGLGNAWTNTKGIWKRSADETIGLTNTRRGDPHTQRDPPTTDKAVRKDVTTPLHCPATPATTWSTGTPWLVISLCDGVGGAFACLERLRLPHEAIIAESDVDLRDFVHQKFPNFDLHAQCNSVTEDVVMKKFNRGNFKGIFLIGGPPCQPFSLAGRRAGFDDHRAAPLEHFCHLAKCLKTRAAQEGFQFICIMEQVATMLPKHRQQVTELFGDVPVLIQAADFGWVQRARFYWGAAAALQELRGQASADWEYMPPGKALEGAGVLRWAGEKCPENWAPKAGWHWIGRGMESSGSVPLPGQSWTAVYKGGRLATFTTVFPHKADHGAAKADAAQKTRFEQDRRRFPLNTYRAENCVQKGALLRVLDAEEREQAMCYPPGWTRGLRTNGKSEEDSRCHAVGNGFHIPSVALLMAILFHLPGTLADPQGQKVNGLSHMSRTRSSIPTTWACSSTAHQDMP